MVGTQLPTASITIPDGGVGDEYPGRFGHADALMDAEPWTDVESAALPAKGKQSPTSRAMASMAKFMGVAVCFIVNYRSKITAFAVYFTCAKKQKLGNAGFGVGSSRQRRARPQPLGATRLDLDLDLDLGPGLGWVRAQLVALARRCRCIRPAVRPWKQSRLKVCG